MESDLENRLENRTTELMETLRILEYEIRERAATSENLDKKQNEFLRISEKLREVDTAFSVLLEKREKDRGDMEENVAANLKQFVFPEIEKLKQKLSGDKKQSLEAIEQMLNRVVSPFSKKLSSPLYSLTGKEIKIANLVKEGKSNEEIADELNIATKTVEYHRNNIRKKLGIKNKKVNLQSHLLSLS
jgi:DNA-binding CsgD family transcriptional regulator